VPEIVVRHPILDGPSGAEKHKKFALPNHSELTRRGGNAPELLRIIAEDFQSSIKAPSGRLGFAQHRPRLN